MPEIIARHIDWRPRLAAFLDASAGAAFRPGRRDCALFCADAIHAMTGHDFAAEYRGRYHGIRSGKSLLPSGDHIAHVSEILPEIHPIRAAVGDIAAVGRALGVVTGEAIACLHPKRGLVHLSLTDATRAWAV